MAFPLLSARARRRAAVAGVAALTLMTATVASSAPAPSAPEKIVDNETVYVVADASGAPRTSVVVDWLQLTGTGTFTIADPAPGANKIESLTEGFDPKKAEDAVTATVKVDGHGDFFYRAETADPLPLEVRVAYFLNGQETVPSELAGKQGRLRIDITLSNHLERTQEIAYENADGHLVSSEATYTVPLLCIPQLELDGTRMTNITPPDGAQLAITGSTLTYAIPMMPMPDKTASIEMDARDIELKPMVISVFPTLPSSADFSVTQDFVDLRDALSQLQQLSAGQLQVVRGIAGGMSAFDVAGASSAVGGLSQLEAALGELQSGAGGLAQLSAGQYDYLNGVIGGIDTSRFASIGDLVTNITSMRQAAVSLETNAANLIALVDAQISVLQLLQSTNSNAQGYAASLLASYPTDADAIRLAGDLATEGALIGSLLSSTLPTGLPYLRAQLVTFRDSITALRQGLEAVEAQAGLLSSVPTAFSQLKASLVVLRDGGDPDGAGPAPFMPGLGATRDGLSGLATGLGQAKSGLAGSSSQLAQLQQLPAMMGQLKAALDALASGGTVQGQQLPGIDTTVDALGQTTAGLGEGVNQLREGEALQAAMKAAANNYTTFLGTPAGATGHLSFLFKLDGVSK